MVIVHGCAAESETPDEGGSALYRIPETGILLTREPVRSGAYKASYFFDGPRGRHSIGEVAATGPGLGVSNRVVVVWQERPSGFSSSEPHRTATRYFVGTPTDRADFSSLSPACCEPATTGDAT